MKHIKPILITCLCLCIAATLSAQQVNIAVCGDVTATGGSMSSFIEQTDYLMYSSDQGSISLGLQQPFFKVYPNPTTGDFTVEITYDYVNLPYSVEVYGMRGEVMIRNEQLTGWQHHMTLQEQQPGLYVIRVQRDEEMGVERIIKR